MHKTRDDRLAEVFPVALLTVHRCCISLTIFTLFVCSRLSAVGRWSACLCTTIALGQLAAVPWWLQ